MLKKTISFILSLSLLFVLALPATAAEESLNKELERITKTVKQTLDIGDGYKTFSGNKTDNGAYSNWYLNWGGDSTSVSVIADSSGKILQYNCYRQDDYKPTYGYGPAFAKTKREDALPVATAFLKKVLGSGETAVFDDSVSYYEIMDVRAHSFRGYIYINGIKSQISFNVSVLAEDMSVCNFRRTDSYGQRATSIPSAEAKVTPDKAASLLSSKIKLKLQYVLSEDGKTASLQYLPVNLGNYIVKADTGELIDLNSLTKNYEAYSEDYAKGGAMASSAGALPALSSIELTAISDLEGTYSKEKLDSIVRSISGLGLGSDYKLSSANYSKDEASSTIYCGLNYVKTITDESVIKERYPDYYAAVSKESKIPPMRISKQIVVDAKTAAIKSVMSSGRDSEKKVLSADQIKNKAAAFLNSNFSAKFSQTALNEESSRIEAGSLCYSQNVNGTPFPQNSFTIALDTYDGTIKTLYSDWKDNVSFDSADGIVSSDAAVSAYTSCFKPVLQYIFIPTEDLKSFSLLLSYKLESTDYVAGVDAKTGKSISVKPGDESLAISYDDIEGCYGKTQIEALAKYGIGFAGNSFKPEAQITQKDAITLLLSAVSNSFKTQDEDSLYNMAYQFNLLTSKEKNPAALMTRIDFIKMLVGATEYGSAAKLKGIFTCGFGDDSSIPAEYFGYAAIAKGLGIVKGDDSNNFNPMAPVSRQDAAIMLYNFMAR